MKQKIKIVVSYLFVFLGIAVLVSSEWLVTGFGNEDFEQYLYHLFGPTIGSNLDIVFQYFKECMPQILLILGCIIFVHWFVSSYFKNTSSFLEVSWRGTIVRKIRLSGIGIYKKHILLFAILFFGISSYYALNRIGFISYVIDKSNYNTIYEDYYVRPDEDLLTFPEEKRNLIVIYIESMENTYASISDNGQMDIDYIPALTKLAKDNLQFSSTERLGGAQTIYGTTWTAAGLVSTSAGIQLHAQIDYNTTDLVSKFLPNLISLGDILEEEGYHQVFMLGSDADFANRSKYYSEHGNYDILDYKWAKENGLVPEDYSVWWGYEDSKLFEFAKDELLQLAKEDQPFNFTMLTADTHFVGGYLDSSCATPYDDQFKNVLLCSSNMIADFVSWIQEQDFYDNTTIVLTGDHLTMDYEWIVQNASDENRTIYNAFINSAIDTENNKNRIFTQFDLFPTILASIGVDIAGNRLGLGTNLFSDLDTLPEELGYDYFSEQLAMNSIYYNNHFVYGIVD